MIGVVSGVASQELAGMASGGRDHASLVIELSSACEEKQSRLCYCLSVGQNSVCVVQAAGAFALAVALHRHGTGTPLVGLHI